MEMMVQAVAKEILKSLLMIQTMQKVKVRKLLKSEAMTRDLDHITWTAIRLDQPLKRKYVSPSYGFEKSSLRLTKFCRNQGQEIGYPLTAA